MVGRASLNILLDTCTSAGTQAKVFVHDAAAENAIRKRFRVEELLYKVEGRLFIWSL